MERMGYIGRYAMSWNIWAVMDDMRALCFRNLSLSQRSFPSPQAEAAGPATGMHKTSDEKNASQFHVSSLKSDQTKCFCVLVFFFFFDFRIFSGEESLDIFCLFLEMCICIFLYFLRRRLPSYLNI